jgi:ribosomal protein L37AE/L43A
MTKCNCRVAMSDVDSAIRDLQESWSKSEVFEPKNCPKCGQPMGYYKNEEGKVFWTCQKCDLAVKISAMASLTMSSWEKLGRFFVHGIAFTVLFFALEFLWIFSSLILVAIGSFLGLIIGILLLFLIVGAVNSVVSRFVWGFSMQDSAINIFLHGLVLSLILLVVDIVLLLPTLASQANPIVTALRLIVSCFFYGLIGKKIAEMWTE